jgi:hypothetical protein
MQSPQPGNATRDDTRDSTIHIPRLLAIFDTFNRAALNIDVTSSSLRQGFEFFVLKKRSLTLRLATNCEALNSDKISGLSLRATVRSVANRLGWFRRLC